MASYALIVNPAAGKGGALQKARALEAALSGSAAVRVLETQCRGSAIGLAATVAASVDRVIAIGGDGTLNEVLNGLMRARTAGLPLPELGHLPAGTGNAAARAFGVGRHPTRVGAALGTARSLDLDVGVACHERGERAFLLWMGAGWDAVLIGALDDGRSGTAGLAGLIRRGPAVLGALGRYREVVIDVRVDGVPFGPCTSIIVANVGEIPFGGAITDHADPTDGHLDAIGVPEASLLRRLGLVGRMMTSSLTSSTTVGHAICEQVELSASGRVPIQVDGEPLGALPATVRVQKNAIRFLQT